MNCKHNALIRFPSLHELDYFHACNQLPPTPHRTPNLLAYLPPLPLPPRITDFICANSRQVCERGKQRAQGGWLSKGEGHAAALAVNTASAHVWSAADWHVWSAVAVRR